MIGGRQQLGWQLDIGCGVQLLSEAPAERGRLRRSVHCVLLRITHPAGIKSILSPEQQGIVIDIDKMGRLPFCRGLAEIFDNVTESTGIGMAAGSSEQNPCD